MWDLPGPGLEPVSPALAGGFLTIAPPGKPAAQCSLHRTALSLPHRRGMVATWGKHIGVKGSFGVGEGEKKGSQGNNNKMEIS